MVDGRESNSRHCQGRRVGALGVSSMGASPTIGHDQLYIIHQASVDDHLALDSPAGGCETAGSD